MPRVSEPIDDTTPLTGSRINIPSRIGWLLRTSRTVGGLSLRQMSAALREHDVHLSSTTLGRIESEGQRSPAALDGYATVLGLPDGALRSRVDMLCRTFPYAPRSLPDPALHSLERFSESFEAISHATPTGGEWLSFARQHASGGGFGLPRTLMEPLIERMATELGRGVSHALTTRYEALAHLRCSAYADVVDGVVRTLVLDPDNQLVADLTSVLSERPTPGLLRWLGSLLGHESPFPERSATYALQNMLVVGGLTAATWQELLPDFVRAWNSAETDPVRRGVLAALFGALPTALQSEIRGSCHVTIPGRPTGPLSWTRSRHNVHYEFARSIAHDACVRLDHPDEPLLARLLFEALLEPRGVRMSMATEMLTSSPFADVVVALLVRNVDRAPDPATRGAAMRVASRCHQGNAVPDVSAWLTSSAPAEYEGAAAMFGRGAAPLPRRALERGLAGPATSVRATLYALGMAQDPRLQELARQPGASDAVRRAARWWPAHGGRILL